MKKIILITLLFLYPFSVFSFDHNHTIFDKLLIKNVKLIENGIQSKVNYSGFKQDIKEFRKYLNQLSSVKKKDFNSWSKDRRLAFLINAYNAFTIDLILQNYPVESIKKIGSFFKSPWKIKFIKFFDTKVSLDDIEHGMIREKDIYKEPRIHFAVVCASIGCPAIQNRAFIGKRLETMLEGGMINFLSDHTRNRYNAKENNFKVSKIFKWYGGDFKERYGSVANLLNFYGKYIKSKPGTIVTKINYLDYDWNLNDTK
jgi:hypothetical protein